MPRRTPQANRSESLIAVISASAALLGSMIGVAGGLAGTHLQSAAEDRRAERSERQAAYTALISAVEAAGVFLAGTGPCKYGDGLPSDTVQATNDKLESVRNTAAQVYLVGSVEAAAASEQLAMNADETAVRILACDVSPAVAAQELFNELDAFTSLAREDVAGPSR
jgi:hypothetical protein